VGEQVVDRVPVPGIADLGGLGPLAVGAVEPGVALGPADPGGVDRIGGPAARTCGRDRRARADARGLVLGECLPQQVGARVERDDGDHDTAAHRWFRLAGPAFAQRGEDVVRAAGTVREGERRDLAGVRVSCREQREQPVDLGGDGGAEVGEDRVAEVADIRHVAEQVGDAAGVDGGGVGEERTEEGHRRRGGGADTALVEDAAAEFLLGGDHIGLVGACHAAQQVGHVVGRPVGVRQLRPRHPLQPFDHGR
jgi:hypothetical protein